MTCLTEDRAGVHSTTSITRVKEHCLVALLLNLCTDVTLLSLFRRFYNLFEEL